MGSQTDAQNCPSIDPAVNNVAVDPHQALTLFEACVEKSAARIGPWLLFRARTLAGLDYQPGQSTLPWRR